MHQMSSWDKLDPTKSPSPEAVSAYVGLPFWDEFCSYLEKEYTAWLLYEYSEEQIAGWNVNYRKSRRDLVCTLFPMEKKFIVQLILGEREQEAVETVLPSMPRHIRQAYAAAQTQKGQKHLMLEVEHKSTLKDIKRIISVYRKKH